VLLEAGATVRVVAPQIESGLAGSKMLKQSRRICVAHLDDVALVIAATNDRGSI